MEPEHLLLLQPRDLRTRPGVPVHPSASTGMWRSMFSLLPAPVWAVSQRTDRDLKLDEVQERLTCCSIPLRHDGMGSTARCPRATSPRRESLKGDAEGMLQTLIALKSFP